MYERKLNSFTHLTYMQDAIRHESGTDIARLSLLKRFREHMLSQYGLSDTCLFQKNPVFSDTDRIKQLKLYPTEENGTTRVLVIYENEDVSKKKDNGRYIFINLGLHNLMSCYDNSGRAFIIGRKYLCISYHYDKIPGSKYGYKKKYIIFRMGMRLNYKTRTTGARN